jgi:rod shape determining protein RodA
MGIVVFPHCAGVHASADLRWTSKVNPDARRSGYGWVRLPAPGCQAGQTTNPVPAFNKRDNRGMPAVFDKPTLVQRLTPWFQGFDGPLAFAIFILAGLGMLTMYSSGYDYGTRFPDHCRNMLIAGFIMFVVAQIPPQRLLALAVPLYMFGVTLLVAVALFGLTKKGARRWLNVGVVIQPSEILKIAMPLMMAWWFQKREGQLRPLDFLVAGVLLLVPVGLIVRQPDLGTALLVLAAGLSVIFFAGLNWKLLVPPLAVGLIAIFFVVIFESDICATGVRWPILHDYQQQRICTLLDPSRDPLGKGFHIIQGMIAIGSGGVLGKGFMQGTQTHLEFIPERTTDFIFASYSEEFGFLGNLILIGSFLFLLLRCLSISLEAPTLFARLLAGSITTIFFTYAFVNMGMVSGILPVVGVPLPFISYGGTAMVTLGLALGMMMSIAKSKRLVQS